jgi:hypothetical protein
MGLDMRPMGKPKSGNEKRFAEIFNSLQKLDTKKPSFLNKLFGNKLPTKEELLEEWFSIQTQSYETIQAPRVGRDQVANDWLKRKYEEAPNDMSLENFLIEYEGYYVIELAKEKDGVPMYISIGQDENVFRGQFLNDCIELLGEELVAEAWNSHLANDTLDYGNRLMSAVDKIAIEKNLEYLKLQRDPPDDIDSFESKLHIVYSLAKWLIFYGKNGHGYEADF